MLFLQTFATLSVTIISLIIGLLLAKGFVAGHRSTPLSLLFALLLSVGFGYLWLLPSQLTLPTFWSTLSRAASLPATGLCWWFACSLIDDRFRLGPIKWLGLIAATVYPTYYFLHSLSVPIPRLPPLAIEFGVVPPLVLCGHMLWMAIGGFREDLLEPRRRFRLWMVAVIASAVVASLMSEYIEHAATANLLRAGFAFATGLLAVFWLLRFSHETLSFANTADEKPEPASERTIDPRDVAALGRLNNAMARDQLFLEPELSIGSLAAKIGIPEHQLRGLINRGMGHRNFSSYLTRLRIDHAKSLLADPDKARQQILRLSMDSGFASLATFNRAFKALEGITPTEFRKNALENALDNELTFPQQ
jgi:AraC-like DNA-binding protein